RQTVREELLRRFGEFARSSAPSAAFAIGVITALGVSKPAAAAGFGGIVAKTVFRGVFARFAMGFAGAAAGSLRGGLMSAAFSRRIVYGSAELLPAPAVIRRFMHRDMLLALVLSAMVVATHSRFHQPHYTVAAIAFTLLAMNWQLLVM